jgi:hypothetical protein
MSITTALHKVKETTLLLVKRERAPRLYGGHMKVPSVRVSH